MTKLSTSFLFVSVFKNVLKDETVCAFISLIDMLEYSLEFEEILKLYSDFIDKLCSVTSEINFYSYLKNLIYTDENIISRGCSDCIKENDIIVKEGEYELSLFNKLFKYNYQLIKQTLQKKYPDKKELLEHLPVFYTDNGCDFDINDVIFSYKKSGYGIFACHNAFKVTKNNEILPVKHFEPLSFDELKNYKYQKDVIKKNTLAFLEGKDANNILLYGDRGCGKSSAVKALVNEFSDYNLKIIQIYKESIIHLDEIFDKIRQLPCKFIIFADDISFEENDADFSSIKAALEGSLSNRPKNVVIYATTNRIHMVRESFLSREGNEVHRNDTIDETVSLSDRFGIVLTYSLLTKNEYLDIASQIAKDCCIEPDEEFSRRAEAFAALKGIRTPRVARQFITDYIAQTGC